MYLKIRVDLLSWLFTNILGVHLSPAEAVGRFVYLAP